MSVSNTSINEFRKQDDLPELQFHDIQQSEAATLNLTESYINFSEDSNLHDESEDLLKEKKSNISFWEFNYYQSFFDVDTHEVLQRILWSMIPLPGRATYLDRQIRPRPDLYGPIWITTTLVFTTAISANIAEYFVTAGRNKKIWHYDFHKVSLAATTIYSYAFIFPVILWALMWYRKSSVNYTLLEILSVYGYSIFIYIPISVLWLIQVTWFQWLLVLIGASLSGLVLIQTFLPAVHDENKKISAIILCLIMLFHTLLAIGFVAYFFQIPHVNDSEFVATTSHPIDLFSNKLNKSNHESINNISVDHNTKKRATVVSVFSSMKMNDRNFTS